MQHRQHSDVLSSRPRNPFRPEVDTDVTVDKCRALAGIEV